MEYSNIGPKIAKEISDEILELIQKHITAIDYGYNKAEGSLTIGFTVKLSEKKNGIMVETKINFVESKITEAISRFITKNQISLPFTDKNTIVESFDKEA